MASTTRLGSILPHPRSSFLLKRVCSTMSATHFILTCTTHYSSITSRLYITRVSRIYYSCLAIRLLYYTFDNRLVYVSTTSTSLHMHISTSCFTCSSAAVVDSSRVGWLCIIVDMRHILQYLCSTRRKMLTTIHVMHCQFKKEKMGICGC